MQTSDRHARRNQAQASRARARALSKMLSQEDFTNLLLKEQTEKDEGLVPSELLRLSYRALKRGVITKQQARLFGCVVKDGNT